MGYFIVPVGICNACGPDNTCPTGKLRYFLEPAPETWFKLSCSDGDFRDNWVCGKFNGPDFASKIRIQWDGNLDGMITSQICMGVGSTGAWIIDDDHAGSTCKGFSHQPNQNPCPSVGFQVALLVFQFELNNEYMPQFRYWGPFQPLRWIGPGAPSEGTMRALANNFGANVPNYNGVLRLYGCPKPCCPSIWLSTVVEITDLLLNPQLWPIPTGVQSSGE